jgi:hypothetical protein
MLLTRLTRVSLRGLLKRDGGVVTVEWVAIAAAVVVGGVAIAYIVLNGLGAPAQKIGSQLMGVGGS